MEQIVENWKKNPFTWEYVYLHFAESDFLQKGRYSIKNVTEYVFQFFFIPERVKRRTLKPKAIS